MRGKPHALLLACALTLGARSGVGRAAAEIDGIVTTHHEVTVGGRVLRYTAKAGLIPIRDNETGDAHGHVFFVSYTLERASGGGRRPVTFVWNGGPGANSTLVHLSGFGPRRKH